VIYDLFTYLNWIASRLLRAALLFYSNMF